MRTLLFAIMGLASGTLSGASYLVKPLGVIVPGAVFGLALIVVERLTSDDAISTLCWLAFPTVSSVIHFVAGCLSLYLSRFFDGDTWHGQLIISLICGAFGAFLLSVAWTWLLPVDHPWRLRYLAAVLGAVGLTPVALHIYDNPSLGRPLDIMLLYVLWQSAVACGFASSTRGHVASNLNHVGISER